MDILLTFHVCNVAPDPSPNTFDIHHNPVQPSQTSGSPSKYATARSLPLLSLAYLHGAFLFRPDIGNYQYATSKNQRPFP